MNNGTQTKPTRRLAASATAALLVMTLAAPAHAGRKPNTGLYLSKYQMIVPTNADYLIHPTGRYVDPTSDKWKKVRTLYSPSIERTDDMDGTVLDLQEQGWVMIGYSAFGSHEAAEHPLTNAVEPGAAAGTKLGMRLRGYDPKMDMKGDPADAAIWANATKVVIQEGYAFSRVETRMARIQTDDGTETTEVSGYRDNRYTDAYAGQSEGNSDTRGESKTKGKWWEAHADVGASKGPLGSEVEGNVGGSMGGSTDKTRYKQNSRWDSSYSGGSAGRSSTDYGDSVRSTSRHWATTLIDKHVNHYDYMVTFWKKADVDKFVLGAFTEPIPRALTHEIGTRHGRQIRAVVGGSPAYDADLWDGDIVLAINGEEVRGASGFSGLLQRHRGEEATLTVWRAGRVADFPVHLNDPR